MRVLLKLACAVAVAFALQCVFGPGDGGAGEARLAVYEVQLAVRAYVAHQVGTPLNEPALLDAAEDLRLRRIRQIHRARANDCN